MDNIIIIILVLVIVNLIITIANFISDIKFINQIERELDEEKIRTENLKVGEQKWKN